MVFASGSLLFILGFFARPDVHYTECSVCSPDACEKNASCYSGGTRTHDLLLSSADVLTTRPPNLPVATGWFEYNRAVGTANNNFKDGFCVREFVIQFRFLPDLTYITLSAQPVSRHRQVRWSSG